jgi:peptide/nickel transport system substrate-binding protein
MKCPDRHVSSILPSLWLAILIVSGTIISPVESTAEPRGEIRVVENWRKDVNVLGHNVLQYLFEYALDRNDLAPSLGISKEWIDETTLEIKLRQGVRFQNGEPFDAYAVKFNFDYQRQHNPGRGVQVYMKNFRDLLVIDRYTLRLTLYEPDALCLNKIIFGPISGWVIGAPRYIENVGWKEFLRHPIGTGPYKVEGEIKDYRKMAEGEVYATLVANPDYWEKGNSKIKRISFIHHSPMEALDALIQGNVDLVTSLIPKDTLKVAESQHATVVKGRQDVRYTVGVFNLMSPHTLPLRRIRVREALNHAVNKEELNRYAFKGNADKMKGVLTDKSGVDLSETETYKWDITKARGLLTEAGYGDGFKMKLYYQERDYLIALLLKRFWGLIDINVEIVPVKWEWIVRHIAYPNTRDGYSWEDEDWWVVVYSDPAVEPEVMGGLFKYAFHSGAPFQCASDFLIEPLNVMYKKLLRTKDRDSRFQIYKEANDYIADQALWVFTMAPLSLYGINKELKFVPHVSQYLYLDYSSVTDDHWSLRGKNN